jgi:guanylate kinase
VKDGEMLEHAHVFGNFYGSPRAPVQAAIEAGADVLFDIDWQGAQQIRNSALQEHVLSIFLLPPSIAALRARLTARGQDTPDTIARRMSRAGTRSATGTATTTSSSTTTSTRPRRGCAPSSPPNACAAASSPG